MNNIKKIEKPQVVYFHDGERLYKREHRKEPVLISDTYIEVTALIRTLDYDDWSVQIKFHNRDGKESTVIIPYRIISNYEKTKEILAERGFSTRCLTKDVYRYLNDASPEERIIKINKTGWINENEYISPSFTVKNEDNNKCYYLEGDSFKGFAQKGTLEEWRTNICRYCENNDILTLSLCVGLAGTLLKSFPTIGTTVVNLIGKSSIGKTTALRVAGSLWGDGNFIKQWRGTDNAHESTSELCNDALMVLDELSQVDSKRLDHIAYMIGNGQGKSRCNKDASVKKPKEWRLFVLSSGEIGIEDKIKEGGKSVKAGMLVRFINIDAHKDFGIFNNLHEFNDGGALSNHLKENANKYHGTASEEFIRNIAQSNKDEIKKIYIELKEKISNKFQLSDADSEVKRISEGFALIYTVGILSCNYKVFTHTREMIEASVFNTFEKLIEDRGGKKSYDETNILQHVKDFLMQNEARFSKKEIKKREDCTEYSGRFDDKGINNKLGYLEQYDDKAIYWIISTLFKDEVCKGFNYNNARNILKQHRMLEIEANGKNQRIKIDGKQTRMAKIVWINEDKDSEKDEKK